MGILSVNLHPIITILIVLIVLINFLAAFSIPVYAVFKIIFSSTYREKFREEREKQEAIIRENAHKLFDDNNNLIEE